MFKQSLAVIAFFLIFLMALFLLERTSSPLFQACIKEYQHNESGTSTNNNPPVFKVALASYAFCTGQFADTHGSGITALATIIIAAFTCTLWITSNRQAQLTREALTTDKRAFVSAEGFEQFWNLDQASGTYSWTFRPSWRNGGLTPTKNATMHTSCEVRNTPLPQNYAFNCPDWEISKTFIGPRGGLAGSQAPLFSGVTAQDIADAQAGHKFIYLWGWIKYHDVFPGTPRYVTHFCWQITVLGDPHKFVPNSQGRPPSPGVLLFNWLQHPEGNYAD